MKKNSLNAGQDGFETLDNFFGIYKQAGREFEPFAVLPRREKKRTS